MYYSKYFEGSVEADTLTMQYCPIPETKEPSTAILGNNSGGAIKRLTILGNAIADTLHDCGLSDARYVPTTGYLYLDYTNSDIGFFLCSYDATIGYMSVYNGYNRGNCIYFYNYHFATLYTSIGFKAGYNVADEYKFCVTVRGDTASMFTIYIGTYSQPTALTNTIGTFYFGVDKRNNDKLFGHYKDAPSTTGAIWTKVSDMSLIQSNTAIAPATKLTMSDNYVVLIEQYMPTAAFIAMDDVFIDPGFSTYGKFYEIDGEVYFCYTPYLIKCVTPVTPTED